MCSTVAWQKSQNSYEEHKSEYFCLEGHMLGNHETHFSWRFISSLNMVNVNHLFLTSQAAHALKTYSK